MVLAPKYIQLAETLKKDIISNLKPGDKFYAQRELARIYGLSFRTVENAMRQLTDEGFIVSYHGKGTFVKSTGGHVSSGQTAGTICLFSYTPTDFIDPYGMSIYNGIRSGLAGTGITISHAWYGSRPSVALPEIPECNGIIFLAPPTEFKEEIASFEKRPVPAVLVGAQWPNVHIPLVDIDNESSVRQALAYLKDKGHRQIAFVTGEDPSNVHSNIRLNAFRKYIDELGMECRSDWYFDIQTDFADYKNILTSKDRPTTLFFDTFAIPLALKKMAELNAMGLRLPEDISLIGFDDPHWAAYATPALTVIRQPLVEIGHRASRKLIDQINGALILREEILPVEIVERDSVAKL